MLTLSIVSKQFCIYVLREPLLYSEELDIAAHYVSLLISLALSFCSVILFPIAITFYITWWFIHFVDGFFSPIYVQLGIDVFGKHFMVWLNVQKGATFDYFMSLIYEVLIIFYKKAL